MIPFLIFVLYSFVAYLIYTKAIGVKHASECPSEVTKDYYLSLQNKSYLFLSIVSFLWLPIVVIFLPAELMSKINKSKDKNNES